MSLRYIATVCTVLRLDVTQGVCLGSSGTFIFGDIEYQAGSLQKSKSLVITCDPSWNSFSVWVRTTNIIWNYELLTKSVTSQQQHYIACTTYCESENKLIYILLGDLFVLLYMGIMCSWYELGWVCLGSEVRSVNEKEQPKLGHFSIVLCTKEDMEYILSYTHQGSFFIQHQGPNSVCWYCYQFLMQYTWTLLPSNLIPAGSYGMKLAIHVE